MWETPPAAGSNWVDYIKQELENPDTQSKNDIVSMHEKPFISRVPAPLHVVSPSAFTPQTLAIGPLHRKLVREGVYAFSFAAMEEYKLMAAKALSAETSHGGAGLILALVQEIVREEKKVRACFNIREMGLEGVGNEELGYMLALDCIFILSIMHSLYNELHAGDADGEKTWWVHSSFWPVYKGRIAHPVRKAVMLDLLLLENQVPLFLVKKAMQMMDGRYGDDVEASLQALVDAVAYRALPFCKGVKGVGGRNAKHLLGCLYAAATYEIDDHDQGAASASSSEEHLRSGDPLLQLQVQGCPFGLVPTATQLHQVGVQFKGHPLSLSHVSFDHHTLTLPIIHVGDETERIFRNLLAYESQLADRADVASYLHFMNSLINTADDVAVLVEAGVISENVGDYKHVAKLWNELATNTMCVFTPRYNHVAGLAKAYVEAGIHGVVAELRERYFSRPWLLLSLLSGTALLVMTFVIMWYTIQVYIKA